MAATAHILDLPVVVEGVPLGEVLVRAVDQVAEVGPHNIWLASEGSRAVVEAILNEVTDLRPKCRPRIAVLIDFWLRNDNLHGPNLLIVKALSSSSLLLSVSRRRGGVVWISQVDALLSVPGRLDGVVVKAQQLEVAREVRSPPVLRCELVEFEDVVNLVCGLSALCAYVSVSLSNSVLCRRRQVSGAFSLLDLVLRTPITPRLCEIKASLELGGFG